MMDTVKPIRFQLHSKPKGQISPVDDRDDLDAPICLGPGGDFRQPVDLGEPSGYAVLVALQFFLTLMVVVISIVLAVEGRPDAFLMIMAWLVLRYAMAPATWRDLSMTPAELEDRRARLEGNNGGWDL